MLADALDAIAAWLWTFAVHGTLIALLVALLALAVRRRPAREEALWRYSIVAGLITSVLQVSVLGSGFAPLSFEVHTTGGGSVSDLLSMVPPAEWSPPGADRRLLPEFASTPDPFASWSAIGAIGAAVLALLGLARFGVRRLALLGLLRGRRRLAPGHPVHVALDGLRLRLGVRRRVRVTVGPHDGSPFALGVLRPEICLPARALELPAAWRDAMLAHELAHLARRDPLWLDLAHALRALFPWQPMLALAQRRMRHLAERRCDAVAARVVGPVAVAECLVEVASWLSSRDRKTTQQVSAMAVEREGLRGRVETLLDDDWHEHGGPRPLLAAAAVVFATAALTVALPGASIAARSTVTTPVYAARSMDGLVVVPPSVPDDSRTRHFVQLLGMLAVYDDERNELEQRVRELRELAAIRRGDAEVSRLLSAIDARLASLDRLRARVVRRAQALIQIPAVDGSAAPSFPLSQR